MQVNQQGMASRTARRGVSLAALLISTAVTGLAITMPAKAQNAGLEGSAQPAQASFNIPAQPLADGLTQFGRQSGWQIAVNSNLISGLATHGVRGAMAPQAALNSLLLGTGLVYIPTGTNSGTLQKQSAGGQAGEGIQLPPVQVQGQNSAAQSPTGPGVGYVATRSATGTKSNTPIKEIPQAISTVTRKQMDDQNAQSVRQALNYSSGVFTNKNGLNGDSYEQLYGRGFQMEEYLDGLRLPLQSVYNVINVDPYDLERIEVLHGPASVLYGQAYPGGMVNLISKTPTETPQHEVFVQGGAPKQGKIGFDTSGPVAGSDKVFYRIVASAAAGDTQVDDISRQRILIAPSITWKPDADTSFTLLGRYQYDPQAGYYNTMPALGTLWKNPAGQLPTSLNPGDRDYDKYSRVETSIGYLFDHRFDDVFSVHQSVRFTRDNTTMQNLFAYALKGTTLSRYAFQNFTNSNQFTTDTNGEAKFSTGSVRHTLTAGIDYQRTHYKEKYGSNFSEPSLDIFAPAYGQAINPITSYTIDNVTVTQFGIYAQDQMRVGKLAVLAGIRNDWAKTSEHAELNTTSMAQSDRSVTWRAGLVYLMDNGLSPYFSYSTSFQPDINTSGTSQVFKPTTGQQYELGVKYQPVGYDAFITLALFNLKQQNVAIASGAPDGSEIQAGEIRSRGLELEGHANLTPDLNLVVAYTHLDNVVTKGTPSGLASAYTINAHKTPAGMPSNMASAWAQYTFSTEKLSGLSLGGGIRYVGSSFGSNDDSFSVHAVTLLDGSVSYDLGAVSPKLDGTALQLSGTNLLDTVYVAGCTSTINCNYGVRRTVLASLKYKW